MQPAGPQSSIEILHTLKILRIQSKGQDRDLYSNINTKYESCIQFYMYLVNVGSVNIINISYCKQYKLSVFDDIYHYNTPSLWEFMIEISCITTTRFCGETQSDNTNTRAILHYHTFMYFSCFDLFSGELGLGGLQLILTM